MDRTTAAWMIETGAKDPAQARTIAHSWAGSRQREFERRFRAALDRGAVPVLADAIDFPDSWRSIRRPPVGAWRLGQWREAERRVGIVGARAAPPSVRARVGDAAAALDRDGFRIVSGAAVGVDSAAHRGVSGPGSVAVVPFGIDGHRLGQGQVSPEELLGASGCIWSAALLRDRARARFVARNHLLAALCERIIVAWAAPASGSMHTVRFAEALGLPIEAWWSPDDPPANDGCRSLHPAGALSDEQNQLLLQLEAAGGAVAGLPGADDPVRQVQLFELECAGHIERLAVGLFRIRQRGTR